MKKQSEFTLNGKQIDRNTLVKELIDSKNATIKKLRDG